MEQNSNEVQIAEYCHRVHICFIGDTDLTINIMCKVFCDDTVFYVNLQEQLNNKEYRKNSYDILQSAINRNDGGIVAALQNPESDLYTTKKQYRYGPFIFRFSRESYNVLFINPHTITHIFIEELK